MDYQVDQNFVETQAELKCSNCGAAFAPGQAFCATCGNKLEEKPASTHQACPQQNAIPEFTPVQPATNIGKLFLSIIGFIGGIISIIFGFIVSDMNTGYWEASKTYGGDAYTGIQNAAAQTANNIQDLAEILKMGMSYTLIVFGIAMIAYFGLKFFKNIEK